MKKNRNKVFVEDVKMGTDTVFRANGKIDIYPCRWEDNQAIVSGGNKVIQKGRMETDDDGTSHFTPYQRSFEHRYRTLFCTDHGEVKETQGGSLIITFRYPKALGSEGIEESYCEESKEIGRRLNRI